MWNKDNNVSVEITDQEIRMMWYPKNFLQNPTSVMFESIPLTPGMIEQGFIKKPAELFQVLESSKSSRGINGKINAQVTLSVPNGFIREYNLPWVPKRDRLNLIRYLADEEIPILPEERVYDAWIEEEGSERLRVVLCGMRKDMVTALIMCFEGVGFNISSLGFSSLAWVNAFAFEANCNTLFIRKLTDQYQFISYHGIIPKLTRILVLENNQNVIPLYNEEIIKILNHYFRPFQESGVFQRVILNSEAESDQLGRFVCNYLKEIQGVEPQLQNMTRVISAYCDGLVKDDKYLAVVGTALQQPNPINNFLRDKTRSKSKSQKQLFAVVLFLVFSLVGLGVGYRLEGKIEKVHEEVYELKLKSEKITGAEMAEASRKQEVNALNEERSTVGEHMRLLLSLSGKGVEYDRLRYQAGQIIINGLALEAHQVQKLLSELQGIGYTNVHLENYQSEHAATNVQGDKRRLRFSLKAQESINQILSQEVSIGD